MTSFDLRSIFISTFCLCAICSNVRGGEVGGERRGNQRVPLRIGNVSFTPREIKGGAGRDVNVSFNLTEAGMIKLTINDWDGDEVFTFSKACDAGDNKFTCHVPEGKLSFDGPYMFSLDVSGPGGSQSVYSPGLASGLLQINLNEAAIRFGKDGKLDYVMPQLGMARIRAFRENKMLVRTLMDWTPLVGGSHSLIWDGKDQSGHEVLISDPGLQVWVTGYSLPENSFIVSGTGRTKPPRPYRDQLHWRQNPVLADKFVLARAPREIAHDPKISLQLSDMNGREEKAPFSINERVKIRMTANEDDVRYMIDERFEVCVYVDGLLLFEDEDGVVPFNFEFDPAGLSTGPHLLTVVAMTTADHIGAASVVINVENKKK